MLRGNDAGISCWLVGEARILGLPKQILAGRSPRGLWRGEWGSSFAGQFRDGAGTRGGLKRPMAMASIRANNLTWEVRSLVA